jgi:hypothetical protein
VLALATQIAYRVAADRVADSARDPQAEEAARSVLDTLSGPFEVALWLLAAFGLVAALVAYLAGPASMLRRRSGRVTPAAGAE